MTTKYLFPIPKKQNNEKIEYFEIIIEVKIVK